MPVLNEITRHAAPAGRPQPIAFFGDTLWVGCWDSSRLYAIDPKTWSTREEVALPGQPFGLAAHEGALRVVISIGEGNDDDDRYIYSYVPGTTFDPSTRIECPDLTGSHLLSNGPDLWLVQQTNRRMMQLDAKGTALRTVPLPTRCAGACFDGQTLYYITADDEFDHLHLATLDLASGAPSLTMIAPMSVEARGLAVHGNDFWTCYREQNEIVSFTH
jgi:hypothetical protein